MGDTYWEAACQVQAEVEELGLRENLIHESVIAALGVLDSKYPEFKESKGPFGDKLAGDLHRRISQAFDEFFPEAK